MELRMAGEQKVGLTFNDLFVQCDRCNGSGPLSETSTSSTGLVRRTVRSEGPCDKCHGLGGRLTETGKAIEQLVLKLREKGRL